MANILGKSYKGRMMIGQAGVFRVASRLLLLGHVPSFPSVDTGVDIVTDGGIRIQVKCAHLRNHPGFPFGAYCFSVKENNRGSRKRDWTKVCDFLIFWGIEEDRFLIIPASEAVQNFWIQPRSSNTSMPRGNRHLASYEEKWELLDMNHVLNTLEPDSKEVEVL